jgi:hypothetical protein
MSLSRLSRHSDFDHAPSRLRSSCLLLCSPRNVASQILSFNFVCLSAPQAQCYAGCHSAHPSQNAVDPGYTAYLSHLTAIPPFDPHPCVRTCLALLLASAAR